MNFVRQRSLGVVEPVVGFIVAIVLAVLGAGYWALAVGMVAGAWTGAIVALRLSPYPLKWRYDHGSMRIYASFSGPLFLATAFTVLLANGTAIAVNAHLGLAAVGAVALAGNITVFANRVDDLVSGTLYPAICAMQERMDLLRESFIKSNRLALMWAMPFGVGLGLFTPELVHYVIGNKWDGAIRILQVTGIVAGINHIGFNWDDYFRARGETRPVAVATVAMTVATLGVGIPLLFTDGLTGLAIGLAVGGVVNLIVRSIYLARLFEGFRFVSHAARSMLPSLPGLVVVLLMRLAHSGETVAWAIGEFLAFIAVTIVSTWLIERPLLKEAVGYVLSRPAPTEPASAS
jgi:O-antigen/teichoic acid export membrane protein